MYNLVYVYSRLGWRVSSDAYVYVYYMCYILLRSIICTLLNLSGCGGSNASNAPCDYLWISNNRALAFHQNKRCIVF